MCVSHVCRYVFLFLLGRYLGVELLCHMVNLSSKLWEPANFFRNTVLVYVPTSDLLAFQFFHVLTSPCYCLLLIITFVCGCAVVFYCGFNLHFSNNYFEHLFMCLFIAIHLSSLVTCLFKSFAYFKLGILSFYYLVLRVLYILLIFQMYDLLCFLLV